MVFLKNRCTCIYIWVYVYKYICEGFSGGSELKHLPAMQETWVRSLGREDPLEKGMATHSSFIV